MQFLRKATMEDMDLIYEWANDQEVRNNSFNSDHIPYNNHRKWFNRIMMDNNVLQHIFMDDDVPVGQIRLNIENNEAEISYSIAANCRGKGYGHKILQLVAEEVRKNYPEIQILIAKVKPDNTASRKLFESEGYELKYSCYTKKPPINTGWGYNELSKIRGSSPILHIEIFERRIA